MLRNRLRNLVRGRRLPRPDKSGLAMTIPFCRCEAGKVSRSNLMVGTGDCRASLAMTKNEVRNSG